MMRFRKGVAYLLSLLLLGSLLGAAVSTSVNHTLSKPDKVENYLAQSKLYDHFVAYTTDQAKKTEGDNNGDLTGSVSLSDAAVQSAAKSAFPSELIQQSVNTFLESNYAWLEGKTSVPNFKIDLSAQKESFAQKVGQYVKTYTAGLPQCTPAQELQQVGVDPLAATCRPSVITPDAAGQEVTQRLSTTSDFLSNPVLTANSVNPKGNQQGQPYYQRFSNLPKAYRGVQKLPYILGALSVVFAAAIIFLLPARRKGWRRVGIVLFEAGAVLIVWKLVADAVFKRLERHVFDTSDVGQLQQSLTDFAHRVEAAIVKIDLWFGVGFIVLALVIFSILLATRRKGPKAPSKNSGHEAAQTPPAGPLPLIKARQHLKWRPNESIMPLGAKPGGEEKPATVPEPEQPPQSAPSPAAETPPKRKKRPRLIQ